MAKVRIHEIAKELGSSSKKILEKAKELGFAVTTVSSAVSQEDAEKLYSVTNLYKEIRNEEEKCKKQLFLMAVEEKGITFIFDNGTRKLYHFADKNVISSIACANKRF